MDPPDITKYPHSLSGSDVMETIVPFTKINKVELSDCKQLVPCTKDDNKVELFRSFKRIVHIGPICILCSNNHRS